MMLTRDQVREVDRRAIEEWKIPALVLMENAGRGTAEVLISLGVHGPVVICCGKGNNGGDGLVVARHLALKKFVVQVLLFANPKELSPEAAIHWEIVQRMRIPNQVHAGQVLEEKNIIGELRRAEWIVDALLGTGLTGTVRPPWDRAIQLINGSPARVLAVDIPSGLDADTGQPLGETIRADHTVTFVAPKVGFALADAASWLGKVHVVDIGAPWEL
jgi:NAD(P)H-hydrate epimerase